MAHQQVRRNRIGRKGGPRTCPALKILDSPLSSTELRCLLEQPLRLRSLVPQYSRAQHNGDLWCLTEGQERGAAFSWLCRRFPSPVRPPVRPVSHAQVKRTALTGRHFSASAPYSHTKPVKCTRLCSCTTGYRMRLEAYTRLLHEPLYAFHVRYIW